MNSHRLAFHKSLLFIAFAAIASVSAQVAPAPQEKDESVVTLSPFEVNSSSDVGYQATNTLAGSRMNTALRDTAASISVFTEELIRDLGALDLSDVLEFANNTQIQLGDAGSFGDSPGGNFELEFNARFRVRGISAQVARNYFKWQNPTDTYNVGRIEDSRGPNSVLFGIGSAGGIINVATKQAQLKRTIRALSLAVGNSGTWRTAVDFNQPLGDKAAIRFNGLLNETGSHQTYKRSESRRAHLAAKYQITPRLQVRAEFETGKVEANTGRVTGTFDAVLPWLNSGRPLFERSDPNTAFAGLGSRLAATTLRYVSNSNQLINMGGQIATTGSTAPIMDPSIASFLINSGGPGQVRHNPYNSVSAFVVAELPRKTFVEIGYNHQDYTFKSHNPVSSHTLRGDPNAALPGTLGSNPYARGLFMETRWRTFDRDSSSDAVRATISSEVNAGKWGLYRLAAFGEFEKEDLLSFSTSEFFDGRPFNNTAPDNVANAVTRRTYVTEGDWSTYYVNSFRQTGLLTNLTDPITGRTLSSSLIYDSINHDPSEQAGGMVGLQAAWFDGRLIAGTGFRHDRISVDDRATRRNAATGILEMDYDNVTKYVATGRTQTLGLVWHATKQISLLYNQATNVDVPHNNARILPDRRVPPPPQGKGQDYGLAVTLLDGKFYGRAVRYSTSTKGEVQNSGAGPHTASHNDILGGLLAAELITQAEHDSRRITASGLTRGRQSTGYELSLTANPTDNWRLSVNYSFTDGIENNVIPEIVSWWAEAKTFFAQFPQNTPTGIDADTIATEIKEQDDRIVDIRSVEGIGMIGNRKHKANFFTRYTFRQGFVKGVFIGGGYRYQGKMLVGRTTDGTNRLQYAPSYDEASFLIGYERNLKNRTRLSVQLNVINLFDETDPIPTRYFSSGDTSRVRRLIVREPRTWRLSTNVSF